MSVAPIVIAGSAPRPRRADPVALLALPGTVYLVLAFALPLVLLLVTSVVSDGRLTLAGYGRFLTLSRTKGL